MVCYEVNVKWPQCQLDPVLVCEFNLFFIKNNNVYTCTFTSGTMSAIISWLLM